MQGTIILVRSYDALAKIIQAGMYVWSIARGKKPQKVYNHAEIYVNGVVSGALALGVTNRSYDKAFNDGKKRSLLFYSLDLNNKQAAKLRKFCLDQGGKGYEYINFINYKDPVKRMEFVNFIKNITTDFDLFILSVHAGNEYSTTADEDKLQFYRELVRSGVNILWGHHPHVLQPWEFLSVEGNNALILPSCGNLISGQTWFIDPKDPDESRVYTGDSAIYQVKVIKKDDDIEVENVNPYLISNYKHPVHGMIVDFFDNLTSSAEIPEKWRDYYIIRLALLKELVRD